MKKMSRKNFRGAPLFSSKSSTSTASHGSSSPSPGLGPSSVRRATWADKIRDKLPPLGENEYEVLWERGVLGVIFLESEKDGIPYVSKATESCISPIVSPGDILKFVNVVRSKDHSFSDFFKILATMKKPVLLRFERQSASTPSSDEDDGSQLFGGPRGSSANNTGSNSRQDAARQDGLHGDEGGPTGGLTKSHSVLQKDQKPPKPTRGAFWRTAGTKESVDRDHAVQAVGPHAMNGENERMAASQGQQRVPGTRDHQVSPRDIAPANGSVDPSLHSPLGQQEYQVYWETGLLGLFFGENRSTNLPVVTRSTSSANLVVRRAVAVHDTLVSANGIKSADYTFEAFFGRLQQMNKPIRLVFRRRQTSDPAVVIEQGDQQQHEHQQQHEQLQQQQHEQLQQQLPHRQEQMHEQNQKRELYEARDLHELQQEQEQQEQHEQKQREQQICEQKQRKQHIREQKQREQHIREQKQREQQIREQKQREQQILEQKQRELQIHEQKQREQQIREEKQRELQMLGQKHREQQALEQKQRELQILEQKQREQQIQEQPQREEQVLEQQRRKQQVLEQKQQEQQILEKNQQEQQIIGQKQVEDQVRKEQQREQELREEQRCQQPTGSHNRTLSITVDAHSLPPTSPADERIPCHNRTPVLNAKHASTPPPLPPSPQVRLEASTHHREYRRGANGHEITSPPSSPATLKGSESARQRERLKWISSTDHQTSPKANGSLPVQSLARSDSLPSALPIIYNSPKVSSSPLVSPVFPSVGSEIENEVSNLASSCDVQVPDRAAVTPVSAAKEKETVQSPKGIALTNVRDKQDCDKTEDQWSQKSPTVTNEEEPVLFADNDTVSLSPTETWDLPEHIPLAEILTLESAGVDSGVDVGVLLSPNAEIDFEDVVMAEAEFVEETELVDEAGLAQEAELIDEDEPAIVEVAYKAGLAKGVKLASETEPLTSSLPTNDLAEDSSSPDVEVGMLAGVEMGIAVEDTESEVLESIEAGSDQNTSPWDLEPESDGQKAYHYSSNTTSSRDRPMSSSSGCIPVDNEMDTPKGDFEDVPDPSDEFSHDPDISGDIDTVEGDVMMQESSKSKVDAANVPKQTKSSMNANLAKYKKKGKSTRGVTKLPALHEDDAVTVPLVAPNAVNTTIQVRGRPKPKLTMADTPDSTTFLIKWKENRSIGLQLKEVRLAKGTYPLVMDVCQKPCCELLRHICVGDVIIEINGRNTSTMGVKKTVNFLKSCSKTTLMKIRHGPAFVNQRMSAAV